MNTLERTPWMADIDWNADPSTDEECQGPAAQEVRERDISAFEERLGGCEEKAYRLAMQLIGNEPAAQEILQQTFLSAWNHRDWFADTIQFNDWVYRTVARAALRDLNYARRQSGNRWPAILTHPKFWIRPRSDEDLDWYKRPSDQLSSADLYRHVRNTINDLPDALRTVLILCDLEEMSVEDGSEILDLPTKEVKENLQAARLAIGHAIGHYFALDALDSKSTSAPTSTDKIFLSEASLTDP